MEKSKLSLGEGFVVREIRGYNKKIKLHKYQKNLMTLLNSASLVSEQEKDLLFEVADLSFWRRPLVKDISGEWTDHPTKESCGSEIASSILSSFGKLHGNGFLGVMKEKDGSRYFLAVKNDSGEGGKKIEDYFWTYYAEAREVGMHTLWTNPEIKSFMPILRNLSHRSRKDVATKFELVTGIETSPLIHGSIDYTPDRISRYGFWWGGPIDSSWLAINFSYHKHPAHWLQDPERFNEEIDDKGIVVVNGQNKRLAPHCIPPPNSIELKPIISIGGRQ